MKGGIWPTKYGYQVRFGRGITRHFKSLQEAERFLTGMRYKVDEGSFDPRDYMRSNPLGFENLAKKWLEIKERSVRKRSYNNLSNYMNQAIEVWGSSNIKNLGYAEIEDFLISRPISDKTRSNMKSCLNDFWKWLVRRRIIKPQQMPEFPEVKFELAFRNLINIETQQKIISRVKEISWHINPKIYIGIRFLATYIKIRPGELLSLKEKQFDAKLGAIVVPHPKEKRPKLAWLAEDDVELLESIPRGLPELPYFRHPSGIKGATAGEPFGARYLYKWWKKACADLGVDGVDLYGGTRHSTTTALGEHLSPEQIQDATGHASKAFRRYFQGERERAVKATQMIKRLSNQPLNNISGDKKEFKLLKIKE